jgi:hypothetical protein
VNLYENDGTLALLDELLKEEEAFIEFISNSGAQKMSFIYDKLKRVFTEHKLLFILVLRLKKIISVTICYITLGRACNVINCAA